MPGSMAIPKIDYKQQLIEDKPISYIDSRVKRMQGFLRKIAKTKKASSDTAVADKEPNFSDVCAPTLINSQKSTDSSESLQLQKFEKDVRSALNFYKVIVSKEFAQKLPGTATVILESIVKADDAIGSFLHIILNFPEFKQEQVDVQPLREALHRNLTNLIRLSDDVLFDSHHVKVDQKKLLQAADDVEKAVCDFLSFMYPRIQKCSLNAELLNCSSRQSSSNSLDEILETDILDDKITSSKKLQLENGDVKSAGLPARCQRDSGIASEISDSYCGFLSEPSLTQPSSDLPPPKPPLPSQGRQYYGSDVAFQRVGMRKAVSNPGIPAQPMPIKQEEVQKRVRPNSDFRGSPRSPRANYMDSKPPLSPKIASKCSSSSSISLISAVECQSNGLQDRFFNSNDPYLRRSMMLGQNTQSSDSLDYEEAGVSAETYSQIQKYTNKYAMLAKSKLSLFIDDGEDFLSESLEESPASPPIPPKKKHNVDNYFAFVEGYNASEANARPSSFYDNLPIPDVHKMTDDELVHGDDLVPVLPPKRCSLNQSSLEFEGSPVRSKVILRNSRPSRRLRSDRDSAAAYDEDNVPALDSVDVGRFLVFKDDKDSGPLLCGGTIDALVVYASQLHSSDLFYQAFLATYRTFLSPMELICKLMYRSNRFRDKGNERVSYGSLKLLIAVIDEMFEELDKSLFDQLRSEVHRLLNCGDLALAKSLREKIVNYCVKLQVSQLPVYEPSQISSDSLFDFKSFELAQQMCVLDVDYFVKIELPEILRWGKEQSELYSPNLSKFINHFNSMSFWVRTMILNEQRQQEREKIYRKFLKIMRHLRRLNNFSSFLAILSALDSTPIRRLDWPKQFVDILQEECQLIDSSSAFKTYRHALSEAKPPCIPYLGLILTDITFIHLGNPQELADGRVNFVKRWQQFNILDSVRRFKLTLYDFKHDERVMDFFREYENHMDEDEMWTKSQQIKPRGSAAGGNLKK